MRVSSRHLAFVFVLAYFPLCAHASDYGCGVTTPYNLGAGVTVVQCWGDAGTSESMSSEGAAVTGGGLTAGDAVLIFGYQCYPSTSPCVAPSSTTYLFVSYSNEMSGGALPCATLLYQASIQGGSDYPNYVWYCPSLPSSVGGVGIGGGINLVCSSTYPTFTPASTCGFISVFVTEFTGGCTASGTGCLDQTANASNPTSSTSLTVATPSATQHTNELVCALGGTINDEILNATNNGAVMTPGASGSYSPGNTVFCKIASSAGLQTLGQSWTGNDIGGMIMVTLQTAQSAPVPAPPRDVQGASSGENVSPPIPAATPERGQIKSFAGSTERNLLSTLPFLAAQANLLDNTP